MIEILKEKKVIKFELEPRKENDWNSLKPEQINILFAAKNNNIEYIKAMTEIRFAAEFNFHDKSGNTPLYEAV